MLWRKIKQGKRIRERVEGVAIQFVLHKDVWEA